MSIPCSYPPPLSDEVISTLVDRDPSPEVSEHLRRCPGCAARLHQARDIERALVSTLHRWDCPPAAQLGDFHLGLLSPDERRSVSAHIALCAACAEEVEELDTFLDAGEVSAISNPRSPAARLRTLVARLLPTGGLQAGFAVRGSEGLEAGMYAYESAGLTISLSLQSNGTSDRASLVCLVVDGAGDGRQLLAGATMRLLQSGHVLAEAALDEWGNLVFPDLEAGTYQLELVLPDKVIAMEGVTL